MGQGVSVRQNLAATQEPAQLARDSVAVNYFCGEMMRPDSIKPLHTLSAEQIQHFASAEQQQALLNNDEAGLKAADERALAAAILASLADLKAESSALNPTSPASTGASPSSTQNLNDKTEKNTSTPAKLPQEFYESNRKINLQLGQWLKDHGFSIVSNSGRNSNCLLISMIQHAKSDYSSEHDAEVNDLRKKVKDFTKKHYPDNPSMNDYSLNCDDELTIELIREINKGITDQSEKLSLCFVTANIDGTPVWKRTGDGEKVAIIFDQGGHYEAVVPRHLAPAQ